MWISEVKHQDPATRTYLGSPSLLRLPGGELLASHDYFGPGCPRNLEGEEHLSSVYRSCDDGRTWETVCHVSGAFWSSLFLHRGVVYLLGTSAQYGGIVIRRGDDGGRAWTDPRCERTGLLFSGGVFHDPPNYHCAPVPVHEAGGRLYRAFENNDPLHWPRGFRACVISADADADLLLASSWRMSNQLVYDQDADPPDFGRNLQGVSGWLEGNVVEGSEGGLWNILRVHSAPVLNRAAMVRVFDEGRCIEFDAETGFVPWPGGFSKFVVRRDPRDGLYWLMANDMTDAPRPIRRNRLSLFFSEDLRRWRRCRVLLDDNLESDAQRSVRFTGFQYPDWRFDGEDLIYLVRTAYDGAHNYHDANRVTFGRVHGFRGLTAAAEEWRG